MGDNGFEMARAKVFLVHAGTKYRDDTAPASSVVTSKGGTISSSRSLKLAWEYIESL